MPFDANITANNLVNAVRGVVTDRWAGASSYVQHRSSMMAHQAAQLTALRIAGQLDQQSLTFEMHQLEVQARAFAKTLINLAVAAIAAVFDAVINVLWGAIDGALSGVGLVGILPAKPHL